MKVLSKLALFTALVVLSACAVAETPFKVYADKDKSFKQIEKFLAGKFTKWENKQGDATTGESYSRVYTYDNDNYATASFSSAPDQGAFSDYQTYTHKKISVEGYTATYNGSGGAATAFDVAGYTIYELTPGPTGSASTPSPRAARKEYALIKIDGSTLSAFEEVQVDVDAKTIQSRDSGVPAPTVYKKL